jgi:hypothetical protein
VLADGVVEGKDALVDHRERHRTGEGLGHARDPHVLPGPQAGGGLHVGDARGVNVALTPALDYRDRPRRSLRQPDQLLQGAVEPLVGLSSLAGQSGTRAA